MENQKSKLKGMPRALNRGQKHNSKVKNEFRERCYIYSIAIIKLIKDFPEKQVYRVLGDQLLRLATGTGAQNGSRRGLMEAAREFGVY